MYFFNELFEHLLGNGEVGNHAVFHRANHRDAARCFAEHILGFFADCLDGFFGVGAAFKADRNYRRLVEHNAAATHINERICRAKVDGQVVRKILA